MLACGLHLVAGLDGITHDYCTDLIRPQAGSLKSGVDGIRPQFDGRNIL